MCQVSQLHICYQFGRKKVINVCLIKFLSVLAALDVVNYNKTLKLVIPVNSLNTYRHHVNMDSFCGSFGVHIEGV